MALARKPFQGVLQIIRFNWHFYLLSLLALAVLLLFSKNCSGFFKVAALFSFAGLLYATIASLAVSYYVYDLSPLYSLNWLPDESAQIQLRIANIHAGFDETSVLLQEKYPNSELHVFDFYDPGKHTEVSIERARKTLPPYRGTKQIAYDRLPLPNGSMDKIFALMSAHEIRTEMERIIFFKEIERIMKPNGTLYVVEHLRDRANFLAYTLGFFHFHSPASWKRSFHKAGLHLENQEKITPFVTLFILNKQHVHTL